jgi:hypothetical protein
MGVTERIEKFGQERKVEEERWISLKKLLG